MSIIFAEERQEVPPELLDVVVVLLVTDTQSLRIGRRFVDEVVVRFVVGFQLELPIARKLYVDLKIAHQFAVVHSSGIGVVADVAVNAHAVVEDLGAQRQFDLIAGDLVSRMVVEADVQILVYL